MLIQGQDKKKMMGMASSIAISSVIAIFCAGTPALAEDKNRTNVIDTLVVTAQKREQNLNEVPLSVRAFSADEIQKTGISKVEDIAVLTPGLSTISFLRPTELDLRIRGIGALGGDQNTYGIYIDGFEVSAMSTAIVAQELVDIERLEVLRGPQGTTFGRNVVAGAINITTKEPDDVFSGFLEGEVARFGTYEVRGGLSVPFTPDIGARISAYYQSTDGHLNNIGAAGGRNDREVWGGRVSLYANPLEQLSFRGSISYQDFHQGLFDVIPDGVLTGNAVLLQGIIDSGFNPFFSPGTLPAGPDVFFPNQNDTVVYNTPSSFDFEGFVATGRADYDFGSSSLVVVAGYIDTKQVRVEDFDLSQLDNIVRNADSDGSFFSVETRLQSNGDEKVDWVVGGYYSNGEENNFRNFVSGDDFEASTFVPGALVNLPFNTSFLPNNSVILSNDESTKRESFAFFGELDYELTSRMNISAGLRYSNDTSEQTDVDVIDLRDNTFAAPFVPGCLTIQCPVAIPDAQEETSSDKLTWRTALMYELTSDVNVYGSISTGYRAGGLQLRNPARPDFGPEDIINYEIGAKAFLFDSRAWVNIAAFYMDYSDIQVLTESVLTSVQFTDNAGGAESRGVEIDFSAQPIPALQISGGLAYLDTEITQFVDFNGVDKSGLRLPGAPEWTGHLAIDYQHHIYKNIDGFIRGTYIYNGEQFLQLSDVETTTNKKYERFDLRFGLEQEGSWRFEAYIENLFDTIYTTGINDNSFSAAGRRVISPPQRYGARMRVSF